MKIPADTFTRRTQSEEKRYQEGRRDGYNDASAVNRADAVYMAGYRRGIYERLWSPVTDH